MTDLVDTDEFAPPAITFPIVGRMLAGGGGEVPIYKVKHGQKITMPGVYDMPMGWYHADCCDGPSVSSTGLRKIWNYSPAHYWDTSPYNRQKREETVSDDTVWLRIGRAAHTLLLEPHTFERLFVVRPPMWTSWQTKDAQKWRNEQFLEGFTVLDPAEMQRVNGVLASLKNHPLYKEGLLAGDIEKAIIWKDPVTGIWLKARPDNIPTGSNILADLKVVSDARTRQLTRKIFEMGYDQQMALTGQGFRTVLRREVEENVVVAVESDRPHGIRIAPIERNEMGRAASILRWSLTKFAECWAAGVWPSYEDSDNEYVRRSDFEASRLDKMRVSGELPKGFMP